MFRIRRFMYTSTRYSTCCLLFTRVPLKIVTLHQKSPTLYLGFPIYYTWKYEVGLPVFSEKKDTKRRLNVWTQHRKMLMPRRMAVSYAIGAVGEQCDTSPCRRRHGSSSGEARLAGVRSIIDRSCAEYYLWNIMFRGTGRKGKK